MSESLGFALASMTGLPPRRVAALAARSERRGFGTIALTESYNDVLPLAAAVAGATHSATIATSIANIGFRHPALMAMGAAAVDELSGGRFVLGLGVGTQWFDRRALGQAAERPLAALAEYMKLLRRLWAAGPAGCQDEGELELYRLDAFRIDFRPLRARLPIYLAAMGPGMLRLVGRLADGVFLGLLPIDTIPAAVESIREAAVAAGREPGEVTIAMLVRTCLEDDLDRGRESVRASIPLYLTFPGYARHLRSLGYGAVVEAVRAALERGDQAGAERAIPAELVERVGVYGSLERCRAGLERYRAAGVDLPIVSTRSTGGDWEATLERAIEAFGPSDGPATER